ncbi:hypothetical protein CO174_01235 [Candidatus Uhrbacteria bacterium CG_4_9_14_3_um_filter_50_9]|uniref:Uncharacterized protein n=1 Tax=Candidatus Uhrbacteria bacterium CG_4_9_14_3_um_filter_50_9 TaxID=1975035 RepID=A0A2M7XDH8_9BACT|nr:MAG: hypothetical protein CO174_01235 [Candidatus Uhrbacteria bacterium CG_4_9_14_3_um_filter_50_9]
MSANQPDKGMYVDFSRIWAEAEWEVLYGQPQRAREQASAWLGVVELNVMCGHESYTQACDDHPYDPPKSMVIPAAKGISLSEMRFNATFVPAGSPFVFLDEHLAEVIEQLGEIAYTTSDHRGCLKTILKDDRVLVTWHTQCGPLFAEPGYVPPFNTFLLKADGREHETYRVTTRLVAAFPTEEEAIRWAAGRSDELKLAHDQNHRRLKAEHEKSIQTARDKADRKKKHFLETASESLLLGRYEEQMAEKLSYEMIETSDALVQRFGRKHARLHMEAIRTARLRALSWMEVTKARVFAELLGESLTRNQLVNVLERMKRQHHEGNWFRYIEEEKLAKQLLAELDHP